MEDKIKIINRVSILFAIQLLLTTALTSVVLWDRYVARENLRIINEDIYTISEEMRQIKQLVGELDYLHPVP